MNAETTFVRRHRAGVGLAPDGAGVRLAGLLLAMPMRIVASSLGRRIAIAVVVSLVLVGIVTALYDNADGPPAAGTARAVAAVPAAASTSLAAPAGRRAPAARPDQAAAAWYAEQQHVSVNQVRALQQRRVSSRETKVLVMAQPAGSPDLRSAYVTVRRVPDGWAVS
jgi:hypothetical protein